jgi:hypothetical protein
MKRNSSGVWTYTTCIDLVQIAAVPMATEVREGSIHILCAIFPICIFCIQQSNKQAFTVGKSPEKMFHTSKLQILHSRICVCVCVCVYVWGGIMIAKFV